jgi:hydroxymethylglutaryl-CoA synthase
MDSRKVGIGDIRFYVPRKELSLDCLVTHRIAENPELKKHLDRALATTGQRSIRFPAPREDAATMAAEAAYELLADNPGRSVAGLRYLATGTETGVDHSKPLSAYVQGMLQKSGLPLPSSIASFQVQHACAGGTLALLSVAGMLAVSRKAEDTGLVTASDISRYRIRTTAEITQGAGAAALLVESNPRLLEFDPASAGYCSRDVDDFFRPLGSTTAQVKGGYSMECYLQSLDEAFGDHASRLGLARSALLASTDAVVLHTPFRNMPELAMKRLLEKDLGLDEAASMAWLGERSFFEAVDIIADIGNSYSASLFIFLANTLRVLREKHGDSIVGKKILIASYGSGNVMAIFTAKVAARAVEVINRWDFSKAMASPSQASMADYELWISGYEPSRLDAMDAADAGSFRLVGVREDGYREYGHERNVGDERAQGRTSGDLRRSIPVRS